MVRQSCCKIFNVGLTILGHDALKGCNRFNEPTDLNYFRFTSALTHNWV